MKILHLSSEASWRGGEQQIAYLVSQLADLGVDPLVACKPASEFEDYCAKRQWNSFPLGMKNSLDFSSAIKLKRLCQKLSIDLIHAHSSHGHGTAFLAYLLKNRTPVILTRRVDFKVSEGWISRCKYTFPKLKKVVCVSDAIRNIVNSATGCEELSTTIYDSINHKKFKSHIGGSFLRSKYNLSPSTTLIGNTSAIAPHKDYFTFVRTAEYYIQNFDNDVRFFVIGKGEQEAEIRSFVTDRGLMDSFIFTGFLKNIEQVLPSLDIFLMTSKTEGLGSSLIDAFAAKVPVVATRAGGIPELVSHQKTGLLSDIGDFCDLAKNIQQLENNKPLTDQIISDAYQKSLHFNTKAMALDYLKLYESILAEE